MKWRLYAPCDEAKIVAHDDGALWFLMEPYTGGQVLWRYDLKTQRLAVTSMLDDPPKGKEPSALNPGKGFCAASPLTFRNRTWVPSDGWASIPAIKGLFGPILALAQDGRLFGAVGTPHGERTLMKWDGRWKKAGTLPEFAYSAGFAVLDGGYMVLGLGGWDSGQLAWISADGKTRKDYSLPKEQPYSYRRLIRVGDKVYATYLKAKAWNSAEEILYELTSDGPKEKARGDVVGVDLSGRGFLKATVERRLGHYSQWKIQSIPAGETVNTPPLPGAHKGYCLRRDASGHIWFNANRWDGRKWQAIVPPQHHLPLGKCSRAIDSSRVVLGGATMTWRLVDAALRPGPEYFAVDEASKTAWTLRKLPTTTRPADKRKPVASRILELHDLSKQGSPVIAGFKTWSPYRPAFVHRADGQWFWVGYDPQGSADDGVVRFDGRQEHFYPTKAVSSGFSGFVFLSPKETVWLFDAHGWRKYDAARDSFVAGEPWDEFAFTLGKLTLSRVAGRGPGNLLPATGENQEVRGVYRKVEGKWQPFRCSLSDKALRGGVMMAHGDRMLVRCHDVGVVEYDATADRWTVLYNNSFADAWFDAQGRRVISYGKMMLVMTGDPFDSVSPREQADLKMFDRLVREMDDNSWAVRKKATKAMKEIAPRFRQRLRAASGDSSLSLEVRVRISNVLEQLPPQEPTRPVGLFEKMHPSPPREFLESPPQ